MNHDYRELNAQEEYYNSIQVWIKNNAKKSNVKDIREARIQLTALTHGVTPDEVRNYVKNWGYKIMPDKTVYFTKDVFDSMDTFKPIKPESYDAKVMEIVHEFNSNPFI